MKTQLRRRSLRLKDYNYSESGMYFVTICTQNRECLFGEVEEERAKLNRVGCMVQTVWKQLPGRFRNIELDEFVIMPNHMHGIITMVGAQFIAPYKNISGTLPDPISQGAINRAPTLGKIIRAFKALTTRLIRISELPSFTWQRNYYEHIIRDEDDLFKIRQYIQENPLKWDLDPENPAERPPRWGDSG